MIDILFFNEFRRFFNTKKISFSEFLEKAHTNRNILLTDWLDNFKDDDIRKINKNEYLQSLYKIMVVDSEENLLKWYEQHISIENINDYIYFDLDKEILNEKIISGNTKNLTRIIKNIFFENVYDTRKIGFNTKPTLFLTLKSMFEDFCLPRCCGLPMACKKILNNNVGGLYAIIRGTENKASIFNPYTASYIFDRIFQANKILTPVLDWNSYLIGFFNSNATEYVGIDVIPDVVNNAELISKNFNKKTKFYCCPSEKIDSRFNFSNIYKNYFDSIFFSPPYFDLEKYKGGEQSIDNYKTYNEWLEQYWDKTCQLCKDVLDDNGHFGFVISNYNNNNISEDLLNIAKKYFSLNEHFLLKWNSFKVLDSEKMKKGNFENFYFMSKL